MSVLEAYRRVLEARLAALESASERRHLRVPRGIDLVSNDYLGLASHPRVRRRMAEALNELPAGSGASRLLRGHSALFEETEERLAAFSGTEAALLFSSGYAANTGLLQTLLEKDALVLSDERNHASLIDGIRLSGARRVIYPHQDLSAVEKALRESCSGPALVVTESVFSMEGDLTPLAELVALVERWGALLVVDEAHATGLYGTRGSGRVEELGLSGRVLATIHTGGKALGSAGAWVAGSSTLKDYLVNRARSLIFSTAPLPVLCAALLAGLELVRDEPHRRREVHRKAALLRKALRDALLPAAGESPIVPIVVESSEAALHLQAGLAASGFDARAVRPPTVASGTSRLRVTVRYPVSDDELRRFALEVSRLLGNLAA